MRLIEDGAKKKIFLEDSIEYTMHDMGSFITNGNKELNQEETPMWYLVKMNDFSSNGNICVTSIINYLGEYTRFVIDFGMIRRVLLVKNNLVYNDTIFSKKSKSSIGFDNSYTSLYDKESYPLNDYIENPLPFDLRAEELPGEIPDLHIIIKFLNANSELRNEIINGFSPSL